MKRRSWPNGPNEVPGRIRPRRSWPGMSSATVDPSHPSEFDGDAANADGQPDKGGDESHQGYEDVEQSMEDDDEQNAEAGAHGELEDEDASQNSPSEPRPRGSVKGLGNSSKNNTAYDVPDESLAVVPDERGVVRQKQRSKTANAVNDVPAETDPVYKPILTSIKSMVEREHKSELFNFICQKFDGGEKHAHEEILKFAAAFVKNADSTHESQSELIKLVAFVLGYPSKSRISCGWTMEIFREADSTLNDAARNNEKMPVQQEVHIGENLRVFFQYVVRAGADESDEGLKFIDFCIKLCKKLKKNRSAYIRYVGTLVLQGTARSVFRLLKLLTDKCDEAEESGLPSDTFLSAIEKVLSPGCKEISELLLEGLGDLETDTRILSCQELVIFMIRFPTIMLTDENLGLLDTNLYSPDLRERDAVLKSFSALVRKHFDNDCLKKLLKELVPALFMNLNETTLQVYEHSYQLLVSSSELNLLEACNVEMLNRIVHAHILSPRLAIRKKAAKIFLASYRDENLLVALAESIVQSQEEEDYEAAIKTVLPLFIGQITFGLVEETINLLLDREHLNVAHPLMTIIKCVWTWQEGEKISSQGFDVLFKAKFRDLLKLFESHVIILLVILEMCKLINNNKTSQKLAYEVYKLTRHENPQCVLSMLEMIDSGNECDSDLKDVFHTYARVDAFQQITEFSTQLSESDLPLELDTLKDVFTFASMYFRKFDDPDIHLFGSCFGLLQALNEMIKHGNVDGNLIISVSSAEMSAFCRLRLMTRTDEARTKYYPDTSKETTERNCSDAYASCIDTMKQILKTRRVKPDVHIYVLSHIFMIAKFAPGDKLIDAPLISEKLRELILEPSNNVMSWYTKNTRVDRLSYICSTHCFCIAPEINFTLISMLGKEKWPETLKSLILKSVENFIDACGRRASAIESENKRKHASYVPFKMLLTFFYKCKNSGREASLHIMKRIASRLAGIIPASKEFEYARLVLCNAFLKLATHDEKSLFMLYPGAIFATRILKTDQRRNAWKSCALSNISSPKGKTAFEQFFNKLVEEGHKSIHAAVNQNALDESAVSSIFEPNPDRQSTPVANTDENLSNKKLKGQKLNMQSSDQLVSITEEDETADPNLDQNSS